MEQRDRVVQDHFGQVDLIIPVELFAVPSALEEPDKINIYFRNNFKEKKKKKKCPFTSPVSPVSSLHSASSHRQPSPWGRRWALCPADLAAPAALSWLESSMTPTSSQFCQQTQTISEASLPTPFPDIVNHLCFMHFRHQARECLERSIMWTI